MRQDQDEDCSDQRSPEQFATDTDISPPRGNPFPVVGIGASARGLEAFVQLTSELPPDTGMAFVLVQHLDPSHDSQLPDLIASHTSMPVLSAHDGLHVEPNSVYVIPPNTNIELEDGTLRLTARDPGIHLPIDIFFEVIGAGSGKPGDRCGPFRQRFGRQQRGSCHQGGVRHYVRTG